MSKLEFYLFALPYFTLFALGLAALYGTPARQAAKVVQEFELCDLELPLELSDALAAQGLAVKEEIVSPGTAKGMRDRVLAVLIEGNRSMAAEEIADALGGISHHTVTPRLAELEQAGRIERTGERHANRSGATAARFRVTEGGNHETA